MKTIYLVRDWQGYLVGLYSSVSKALASLPNQESFKGRKGNIYKAVLLDGYWADSWNDAGTGWSIRKMAVH